MQVGPVLSDVRGVVHRARAEGVGDVCGVGVGPRHVGCRVGNRVVDGCMGGHHRDFCDAQRKVLRGVLVCNKRWGDGSASKEEWHAETVFAGLGPGSLLRA